MQWEELLYVLSMYQRELFVVLACLIFLLGVIKDNKRNPNLRLLKVEYASSSKKHKKNKMIRYYLDETTGKIKIIEEHTNERIIDKGNWN